MLQIGIDTAEIESPPKAPPKKEARSSSCPAGAIVPLGPALPPESEGLRGLAWVRGGPLAVRWEDPPRKNIKTRRT